jgi:putative salt-induced outer membrane protein YdiY
MNSNLKRDFLHEARLFQSCLLMLLMLGISPPALAQKTDLIYLENGDRVTGEIKELQQGQLRVKTDAFGTIYVAWEDIDRVNSEKWIQIEMADGTRMFGQMPQSDTAGVIELNTLKGIQEVDLDAVVRAETIKVGQSFWQRLDKTLRVGLNYTKASDVGIFNIAADATYRTQKYRVSVALDSVATRKAQGTDSRQANFSGTTLWYRPNRWFWFGSAALQTDDELGIDLRALFTAGTGRFVMQTKRTELWLAAGLAANQEYSVESVSDTALEGLLQAEWNFFKLHMPRSNIKASLSLYPGITETDRFRGNFNIELRQEFIADMFWDLTFYLMYDSKPPQGAQANENYGVITSLGYSF